jgi:hypothetical protein
MTFWDKYYMKMIIPVIVVFLLLLIARLEYLWKKRKLFPNQFRRTALVKDRLISQLVFYCATLYTFIISSAISPFKCVQQSNGSSFLSDYPTEPCFSGRWATNFPAVVTFFVFYGLLFPLSLIFIFLRYGSGSGKDSLWFTSRFGLLTRPYRRSVYYWELINLLRRAILAITTSFWKSAEAAYVERTLTALCFLLAFTWLDAFFHPFAQGTRFVAAT